MSQQQKSAKKEATPPVVTKKHRPYPIEIVLRSQGIEVKGRIVKLVEIGFLMEHEFPIKVHQLFDFTFNLPVQRTPLSGQGVVVKTHDQFRGELGKDKNYHIAELHFKDLHPQKLYAITQFLKAIKQID